MINSKNVLRQVTDIQVQADQLIKNNADLTEIANFAQYSHELKKYLHEHVKDDFILNLINEIPILDLDEPDEETGFFDSLLYFFGGLFGMYSLEQKRKNEALNTIRDIKGKYASAEFMLKNYLAPIYKVGQDY
ncbi:hypothetical protein WIW50_07630 [Flavobacteriaceae bacterium 3-367]